jgi:subtilase family serine protease
VSSFIYSQRVTALRDGGSYRMRVQFRWYGPDGSTIKTKIVRSGVCRQPAQLPDLKVTSVTAKPALAEGSATYTVTVQNVGTGDAGGVEVALRVDGGTAAGGQVPAVGAGKSASVDITAPACQGFVRAAVDPRDRIKESSETDNVLVGACPT